MQPNQRTGGFEPRKMAYTQGASFKNHLEVTAYW